MGNYLFQKIAGGLYTRDVVVDPDDGMMVYWLTVVSTGGTNRIYLFNGDTQEYEYRIMWGEIDIQS